MCMRKWRHSCVAPAWGPARGGCSDRWGGRRVHAGVCQSKTEDMVKGKLLPFDMWLQQS